MEQIEPSVTEKIECEDRGNFLFKALPEFFSEYQDFDAKTKVDKFSAVFSSTSGQDSVVTLVEEIKHVVTEKHEFEKRAESVSFFNLRTIKILMQGTQTKIFERSTHVQVECFQL